MYFTVFDACAATINHIYYDISQNFPSFFSNLTKTSQNFEVLGQKNKPLVKMTWPNRVGRSENLYFFHMQVMATVAIDSPSFKVTLPWSI
jgi:hypothetical protein